MSTDWVDLPLLSSSVQQRADAAGNTLSGSQIDSSSTVIDPRISDFILYGVFNGAFARGPLDPASNIDDNNPLPDWTGPIQVSGGAITWSWVLDASSAAGYILRATISPGAASDESYMEGIAVMGGDYFRSTGDVPRATVFRSSITGAGAPTAYVKLAYLNASNGVTGADPFKTASNTLSSASITTVGGGSVNAPNSDAFYARIRIGVTRNTMAAADTATIDFCNVRREYARPMVLISDSIAPSTYKPGQIVQSSGVLIISGSDLGQQLQVSSTGVDINGPLTAESTVTVAEQAAPSTPASGYYAIYPKTDGKLYGKNDSGTEVALGGGSSTVIRPSISADQNNWNPTGLADNCVILVDLNSANRTITGLTALADGAHVELMAQSSTNTITLSHLSGSSTAANQFRCPAGVNYVIGNKAGVRLVYDATDTKWRVVGPA